MKTKDTKPQKQQESEAMRLFKEEILKHYTNVPIKGSDKVYHTSLELKYTMHDLIPDLTVQEVSNSLNFANPSFFGKFFKAEVGISPKAFVKSLK